MFICWSGPRSLELAERLRTFLVEAIPSLKGRVFSSPQIEKGARWFEEVLRHLEAAQVGLICLTAENLTSPWLHFEAGALLKGLHKNPPMDDTAAVDTTESRIFTYLHGVTAASLSGPLAQYQSTSTTRSDTRSLVRTLSKILTPGDRSYRELFDRHWPAFDRDLKKLHVTVQQLLPEFERWFRRKTFEEPLQQCTDQNWLGRYDGARQTHDRLSEHVASVRLACPRYQADLFDRLLALVEAYAMDVRALLVRAPAFALSETGELQIPNGVLRACESRRSQIKEIVGRILDPLAVPVMEEAARFWLSDSFDLRKMMVHRCEYSVLAAREAGDDAGPGIELLDEREAKKLFESLWDLDRIFGYLVMEYVHPQISDAAGALYQAGAIEVERFRAKSGVSMMPLYYACRALKGALETRAAPVGASVSRSIQSLFNDVRGLIEKSRAQPDEEPSLDRGGQLRRLMTEVDALLSTRGRRSTHVDRPEERRSRAERRHQT